MDSTKPLSFSYDRRFGVEQEICSFDRRDFKKQPLDTKKGEQPEGIEEVAMVLRDKLKTHVQICGWQNTHDNEGWIIKPDSSCGIEICSPVSKGWHGIERSCKATQALASHPKVFVDSRCGLHLHADVADCEMTELGSIIAHWIKCEFVFLNSVPSGRKRNRYCQQIGLSHLFQVDTEFTPSSLVRWMGETKYYTLNTYHMNRGNRSTMEWRIAEGEGCLDAFMMKNWIRLLIHFVERAKATPMPSRYRPSDPRSGLLWFDPLDVMEFMGFWNPLSKGLEETRNWFVARLWNNLNTSLPGIWSAQSVARAQVEEIISRLGIGDDLQTLLKPKDLEVALYHTDYRN
jgi:hypothetical protein